MEVMKRLDVASLLRLSEVCHQLHNAAQDRSIWRHRFVKDFGGKSLLDSSVSLRVLYPYGMM